MNHQLTEAIAAARQSLVETLDRLRVLEQSHPHAFIGNVLAFEAKILNVYAGILETLPEQHEVAECPPYDVKEARLKLEQCLRRY